MVPLKDFSHLLQPHTAFYTGKQNLMPAAAVNLLQPVLRLLISKIRFVKQDHHRKSFLFHIDKEPVQQGKIRFRIC